RQRVAGWYEEALAGMVKTPQVPEGYESVWAQYTLVTDRRADLMAGLKEEGVPTAVYYPKPLHLQKAFASLGHNPGDFPVSEGLAGKVFSIPMSPYVTEEVVEKVAAGIKRGLAR
ncbi:MAG: DegT/DnrJ/EryC1/StrS family aminotransferase, partial [Nitrospinae bacterium]|nr:DegT/DnrJ/EryC1/StrS family aminotransferase [Nitrospinota bacterium]